MRSLALAAVLLLAPLATACDSDDPAAEGGNKPAAACLDEPGIARPPTAALPCELLPPDFVAR